MTFHPLTVTNHPSKYPSPYLLFIYHSSDVDNNNNNNNINNNDNGDNDNTYFLVPYSIIEICLK